MIQREDIILAVLKCVEERWVQAVGTAMSREKNYWKPWLLVMDEGSVQTSMWFDSRGELVKWWHEHLPAAAAVAHAYFDIEAMLQPIIDVVVERESI